MKYVNLPIQAAAVRAGLESNAAELVGCTGCVTDAVQETADSSVSIYTAELLEFASSHPEAMNLAAVEFDVSPKDYDDWTRYTEAVASLAWYDEASGAIYEELNSGLELVAIDELMKRGYRCIPETAYNEVMTYDANDVCSADDLEEFRGEALTRFIGFNAWA